MDMMQVKRVVVKIGSSSLTHPQGMINIRAMEKIVKVLSDIKNSGKEIILVTSAAVAVGMGKLGLKDRPKDIPTKQATAAVGQCELMYLYDKMFSEYHHTVAQVLLAKENITNDGVGLQNIKNTFRRLIELDVIPVVNENDTVATDELKIGDNDNLSSMVAYLTQAEALIILSDVDGLYTENPKTNPDATRIEEVGFIDEAIHALAGGAGSAVGTGGMTTKIQAAKYAQENDIGTFIVTSAKPDLLYDLFENKSVGTYFKRRSELA